MEKNDYSAIKKFPDSEKAKMQKDVIIHLAVCFQSDINENKHSLKNNCDIKVKQDEKELDSERYGTPNSIFDKLQFLSPRKTTCDKKKDLTESPIGYKIHYSSAKRVKRFSHAPSYLFEDSNEKNNVFQNIFKGHLEPNQQNNVSDKDEFVLPNLEHDFFSKNIFESPMASISLPKNLDSKKLFELENGQKKKDNFEANMKVSKVKTDLDKCNCRNSQCLKMYCECLKKGKLCDGCYCTGCENHDKSHIRKEKIEEMNAKKVKSGISNTILNSEKLQKVNQNGCNCRKNSCIKKYCECQQLGFKCGNFCRCVSCKNGKHDSDELSIVY